jgi:hypothetical protein
MDEVQRIFSPDRRFFVLLSISEIRMSHWITSAALWEDSPRRLLLQLGSSLWSAEQVTWQADGTCLTVELRRYPGDAPALQLDIYPGQQHVIPRGLMDAASIRFEDLDQYLEIYYQQHRRT